MERESWEWKKTSVRTFIFLRMNNFYDQRLKTRKITSKYMRAANTCDWKKDPDPVRSESVSVKQLMDNGEERKESYSERTREETETKMNCVNFNDLRILFARRILASQSWTSLHHIFDASVEHWFQWLINSCSDWVLFSDKSVPTRLERTDVGKKKSINPSYVKKIGMSWWLKSIEFLKSFETRHKWTVTIRVVIPQRPFRITDKDLFVPTAVQKLLSICKKSMGSWMSSLSG